MAGNSARPRDGARRVTNALGLAFAIAAAAAIAVFTSACGQNSSDTLVSSMRSKPRPASAAPSATGSPAQAARPRVVVLGDSLSAGLGLSPQEAFPALLQRKIDTDGLKFEVINAGVSGDTSAGGLRRLDWALDGDVQVLIVGLGANDGLRGLPVDEMRRNLSTIVERAQARHITVVLCGMEAPPNFGASYTTGFRAAFKDVAKKYDVALVPFLLDGVAGLPDLNQEDGIHPNVRGAQRVADTVWSTLKPLLASRRLDGQQSSRMSQILIRQDVRPADRAPNVRTKHVGVGERGKADSKASEAANKPSTLAGLRLRLAKTASPS